MRSSENSLEAFKLLFRRPLAPASLFLQECPFQNNQPIFFIQNRALREYIVFAAVQFLQNQLSADNNHPQFKPQTSFQRFTQGRAALEHLERAVSFIRHQSLERKIRFAFGDLRFAYFEFFQVVLRDIDAALLPIDGNILPKVDEL